MMKITGIYYLLVLFFGGVYTQKRPRSVADLSEKCLDFANNQKSGKLPCLAAKAELAANHDVGNVSTAQEDCRIMYDYDWGASLYYVNNTAVAYEYIFKCNSENIHSSFARHAVRKKRVRPDVWADQVHYYMSDTPQSLHRRSMDLYGTNNVKVFTFLRDPLSHFISGLVESYFRKLHMGSHPNTTERLVHKLTKKSADLDKARHILHALIVGSDHSFLKKTLSQSVHYRRLTFSLLKWKPGYIGYLETFEEDWAGLNAYLKLQVDIAPISHHITSNDPMNLKKSLIEVLDSNPEYMRAVCRLLMIDYVCLEYELPVVCANMTVPLQP